ncbi:MAG: hypothetical protein JXA24_08115 [Proteobacteria bacterium]|nr:hypothetical protein [Pseudomonadota bacterium]
MYQTEVFAKTAVTESTTKTIVLANSSGDREQRMRAIGFDRGSNSAGHFRIDRMTVGGQAVGTSDVVIPPGSSLQVTITYAPMDLNRSLAAYGGWVTGERERWIPKHPDEVGKEEEGPIYQRAIIEAVYDYPGEGIFFVELVGTAVKGPNGEEEAGGAFATCTPGNGVACYTGGFALDIPDLAPGGPKLLELTGPIRFSVAGGEATLRMDDFPYAIMYLRSEEIPQLPSGVTATMIVSGAQGAEAKGTFDGARLDLAGVGFRIRVALGELTADDARQGIPALVDFELSDLVIETVKPLSQGAITMRLETTIPENPSGNELFDQFLSGASVIAIMEGELAF